MVGGPGSVCVRGVRRSDVWLGSGFIPHLVYDIPNEYLAFVDLLKVRDGGRDVIDQSTALRCGV